MLEVTQRGAVVIISREGKTIVLTREFGPQLLEVHGIITTKDDWFFRIVPTLFITQRERQLRGAH